MMTQSSAHTQNHLWAVSKLMTVFHTLNSRDLNLKYIVHRSFVLNLIKILCQSQLHFA